jgi:hypothetical protein
VVVQRFCKPKVGGSNPSPGTICFIEVKSILKTRLVFQSSK